MSVIMLLVVLAVFGFVMWIIMQIPMPPVIKNIVLGVAVLAIVLWLLQAFGLIGSLGAFRIR